MPSTTGLRIATARCTSSAMPSYGSTFGRTSIAAAARCPPRAGGPRRCAWAFGPGLNSRFGGPLLGPLFGSLFALGRPRLAGRALRHISVEGFRCGSAVPPIAGVTESDPRLADRPTAAAAPVRGGTRAGCRVCGCRSATRHLFGTARPLRAGNAERSRESRRRTVDAGAAGWSRLADSAGGCSKSAARGRAARRARQIGWRPFRRRPAERASLAIASSATAAARPIINNPPTSALVPFQNEVVPGSTIVGIPNPIMPRLPGEQIPHHQDNDILVRRPSIRRCSRGCYG